MKTGYLDINISKYFKTSLSSSVIIERVFLAIKNNDSVKSELVDASTIYFESSIWDLTDRWDTFYGVSFGKINVLPHEGGIQVKYQISVLPFRILAIAFLLFGCLAPIYILFAVTNPDIRVCLQVPITGLGSAAFAYFVGIAIIVTRLNNLIQRVIKD